jgi:hypothetical protein
MPLMSEMTKPPFRQMLGACAAILDRLEAHCAAKSIDPAVFLTARLYPDMFPFHQQVIIACEFANGAVARLSGRDLPDPIASEVTLAFLKARISQSLAFIASVPESEIDGTESRIVTMKIRGETMQFPGTLYLSHVVSPNFYFHLSIAYAILRHNGLDIGKGHFLGRELPA